CVALLRDRRHARILDCAARHRRHSAAARHKAVPDALIVLVLESAAAMAPHGFPGICHHRDSGYRVCMAGLADTGTSFAALRVFIIGNSPGEPAPERLRSRDPGSRATHGWGLGA